MSAVRVGSARIVSAGLAYAAAALILGWFLGGQALTGRVDAWLAAPVLMPGALLHARLLRGADGRTRAVAAVAALVVLIVAQGAIHLVFAGRLGGLALVITAFAGALCLAIASALDRASVRWSGVSRWAAYLFAVVLWSGASHAALALWQRGGAPAERPRVVMLTALPLRWAGANDLSAMLDRGPADHPALAELADAVDLQLVDSLEIAPQPDATLFLSHPPALAPADLVQIDAHVRAGGDAVILADALSSWPPPHPLGDPRNPPITSLLTPLLDHWGIELAAPEPGDEGDVGVLLGPHGPLLRLHSAGRFVRLPKTCRALGNGFAAECRIGAGTIFLLGDADLLHQDQWQPPVAAFPWLSRSDAMVWLAARLRGEAWDKRRAPLWIRPRAN